MSKNPSVVGHKGKGPRSPDRCRCGKDPVVADVEGRCLVRCACGKETKKTHGKRYDAVCAWNRLNQHAEKRHSAEYHKAVYRRGDGHAYCDKWNIFEPTEMRRLTRDWGICTCEVCAKACGFVDLAEARRLRGTLVRER